MLNFFTEAKIALLTLSLLFLIINCGGGGSGSIPKPTTEILEGTITGKAALGPIEDGNITAYSYSSGIRGDVLGSTSVKTTSEGLFTLTLKIKNTPILLCVKNGFYAEAASINNINIAFTTEELCALTNYKQDTNQNISITYFTHLAFGYANFLLNSSSDVSTIINQANLEISNWIETDIITTVPVDIISIKSAFSKLTPEHKYGFANAAVSSLMSELNNSLSTPQDPFTGITSIIFSQLAFEDIKNDGYLDGQAVSGNVEIGTVFLNTEKYRNLLAKNILTIASSPKNLSAISETNQELKIFKINFAAYSGSIFRPVVSSGPIIKVNTPNDSIIVKGMLNANATITDTVAIESVVFSLINSNAIKQLPILSSPLDLNNTNIIIDSSQYNDDIYSIEIEAVNVNGVKTTKTINNIIIKNATTQGNIAPTALADNYDVTKGNPIDPFLVLGNDNDSDLAPNRLIAILVTRSPTKNSAIVKSNSNNTGFIYTPAKSTPSTKDVFSYYAYDGLDVSNIVNVTVTFNNIINTQPIVTIAKPLSNSWRKPVNGKVSLPILASVETTGLGLKSISHQLGGNILKLIPSQFQPTNGALSASLNFEDVFTTLPDGLYDYKIIAEDRGALFGQSSVKVGIDNAIPNIQLKIGPSGLPLNITERLDILPTTSSPFGIVVAVADPGFPISGSGILKANITTNLGSVSATAVGTTPTRLLVSAGEVTNLNSEFMYTIPVGSIPRVKYTGNVSKARIYKVTARCLLSPNYNVLPTGANFSYQDGETGITASFIPGNLVGRKICWIVASDGLFHVYYKNDLAYTWSQPIDSFKLSQVTLSKRSLPITNVAQITVVASDKTNINSNKVNFCLRLVASNNHSTIMNFVNRIIPANGSTTADIYLRDQTIGITFPTVPTGLILDSLERGQAPSTISECVSVVDPEPSTTPGLGATPSPAVKCITLSLPVSLDFVENKGAILKNPATGSGVQDAFKVTFTSPTPTLNGCQ